MFQDFFLNLSFSLNSLPVISIWLFQIIFCYLSILLALKFFGKVGIYVYVSIAIILANIQVLKVVEFPFFPEPMALGTILFLKTKRLLRTFQISVKPSRARSQPL